MRGFIAMVAIFMVLFLGMGSAWGVKSGNEIYKLLTSKGLCSHYTVEGYILGAIDATLSLQRVYHLPVQWTIPSGVTKGNIFDTIKQYLEKHPEERNESAYVLVNRALAKAFPPKK